MTEKPQSMTPIEAINEFYKLKNKYETDYYEKYVSKILKRKKTLREKRVEFSKLPKHECINCKRNVGTVFSVFYPKEDNTSRKFIAKCGDLTDPCPLDIQIIYARRPPIDKAIKMTLANIEDIKLNIIKEKNNALFFNKNVVDIFDRLTKELKQETEFAGLCIETNILKNDNPEKRNVLKKMVDEFGQGCVTPFKRMINEYVDTNNLLILNRAVGFYKDEMMPKLKEILTMKYDACYVDCEGSYDTPCEVYKLMQLPTTIENTELVVEGEDKVISFVRGIRAVKSKTMKQGQATVRSDKTKTKKIKQSIKLVMEEEPGPVPVPELAEGEGEKEGEERPNVDVEVEVEAEPMEDDTLSGL